MPVRVDLATAQRFAAHDCGWSSADGDVTEIITGFGNHNWRVPLESGDVVLKIGPASSAPKWAAAQVGADRARSAGLAVPELFSARVVGEHVVRTLHWVDGQSAATLIGNQHAQNRLGADLGAAVAALHTGELEGFASRLDGSSVVFPTWAGYVADRLVAIERRASACGAPEPALRHRAAATVEELAASVSAECRPVVCHRDLHLDNLIVGPDGTLRGIVDWDMAEAWDAAGEWFKLELFLFEQLPHTRDAFDTAYEGGAGIVGADRRRLVLLIESLNVVANAGIFSADFVDFGLRQLDSLTSTRRGKAIRRRTLWFRRP